MTVSGRVKTKFSLRRTKIFLILSFLWRQALKDKLRFPGLLDYTMKGFTLLEDASRSFRLIRSISCKISDYFPSTFHQICLFAKSLQKSLDVVHLISSFWIQVESGHASRIDNHGKCR